MKEIKKEKPLEDEFSKTTKDTFLEKLGNTIIDFCSSWLFLFLNIIFFTFWLISGYGFNLLTLWVSLEAIILTVLILIQNKKVEKSDRNRSIKDYKIDTSMAKRLKRIEKKLDKLK
jgi:uncharacterized membrane protein